MGTNQTRDYDGAVNMVEAGDIQAGIYRAGGHPLEAGQPVAGAYRNPGIHEASCTGCTARLCEGEPG